MFLDRVRLDAEDNPDESLRGAPGAAGAASRPWTEWSEGGVKCLCSAWERFLTTSGKWLEAYLCYSRGRPRYVNLDGKGVDLGGCWSPGSSPGMIAREH
jgi:hypothetical protein